MVLLAIILASLAESIASFTGGLLVILKESFAKVFAHRILGFAIGALLGVSFFDLIPEAVESIGLETTFVYVLSGIVFFFLLEKFLFWYHCHNGHCDVHTFNYLILFGDAIHNFIDGIIIGLSFLTSIPLGIATTTAVVLHEIPQEIADFGVLMAGGYSRSKAMWYNFLISLTTIGGALAAYAFGGQISSFLPAASGAIAGNFLYIALSDLMPEIHEQSGRWHVFGQLALIVSGIGLMYFLL